MKNWKKISIFLALTLTLWGCAPKESVEENSKETRVSTEEKKPEKDGDVVKEIKTGSKDHQVTTKITKTEDGKTIEKEIQTPGGTKKVTRQVGEKASTDYSEVTLSLDEALKGFYGEFPDAKLYEFSLDTDYGAYVYKLKGKQGDQKMELKLNPSTGEVLEKEQKSDPVDDAVIDLNQCLKPEELIDKLRGEVGELPIEEWTYKDKHGRAIFEVEFQSDRGSLEYRLDAHTGEILERDN